jgi:hypothetical protein
LGFSPWYQCGCWFHTRHFGDNIGLFIFIFIFIFVILFYFIIFKNPDMVWVGIRVCRALLPRGFSPRGFSAPPWNLPFFGARVRTVKLQILGVNCELQIGCNVSSTGELKFLFLVADFCKPNMIFASNFFMDHITYTTHQPSISRSWWEVKWVEVVMASLFTPFSW